MSKDNMNPAAGENHPTSALEWTVRLVSLLAILALLGFLAYDATRPVVGPNFVFEIEKDKVQQHRGGWSLPVTITNRGTLAIGQVHYEVVTPDDVKGGVIPLLGGGESFRIETWFESNPVPQDISVRVLTYSI